MQVVEYVAFPHQAWKPIEESEIELAVLATQTETEPIGGDDERDAPWAQNPMHFTQRGSG